MHPPTKCVKSKSHSDDEVTRDTFFEASESSINCEINFSRLKKTWRTACLEPWSEDEKFIRKQKNCLNKLKIKLLGLML